jgi:hypothetical protein
VVLKAGWLNRQFDQVSKNVNEWPAWMKRAAGFEEETCLRSKAEVDGKPEPHRAKPVVSQQKLEL